MIRLRSGLGFWIARAAWTVKSAFRQLLLIYWCGAMTLSDLKGFGLLMGDIELLSVCILEMGTMSTADLCAAAAISATPPTTTFL